MYIRRVVLENIRGFEKLDFTFERPDQSYAGWTVITGDNASGKSALLKSIALALVGPETIRTLQPNIDGWVRARTTQGTIAVQIVAGERDRFTGGRRYERPFWSELTLSRASNHRTTVDPKGEKYLKGGKGPTRGPWVEYPEGWFCSGYGPFRRLYGHSPEAQRLMSTRGKVSRFATMFREDATLVECDLWLRDLKYRELDGDKHSGEVLHKVLEILNTDFLQHDIRVVRVDADGLWLEHTNGITLPLEEMSDGYRSSLAMLVDILRQLIDVYGLEGFKEWKDGRPFVEYTGVVLIDEVDAHLHPAWQRRIGEWFRTFLPNIQFIVSTHSALVCQAADEHGLFHLPAPGSDIPPFQLGPEDYRRVIAGKADEIYLSPAFGLDHTRSPRAVRAREQFAQLQAKKSARSLTDEEREREGQLMMFILPEELEDLDESD
jgi:energy-coupling factor transporter ATP-binding protein EcfA2